MPINLFPTDHYKLAFLFNNPIYRVYSILYNYFNYYHLILVIILINFFGRINNKSIL